MILRELRLALRTHGRAPGFLALAILTMALGIGAATVLFSVTQSVLWRPLHFADSERLVTVYEINLKRTSERGNASVLNFRDWRGRVRTLDGLSAMTWGEGRNFTGRGISERVASKEVSAGFFETLGVAPQLGRAFRLEDEQPAASRAVLLTHGFWQRVFGGTADVVGRDFKLDGQPCSIAGVLPASFHLEFSNDPDVFLPLRTSGGGLSRDRRDVAVIGRLNPGIPVPQVSAEMQDLSAQLASEYPQANLNWGARVANLRQSFTSFEQRNLFVYLGFSGLVLLIACANVAGLLLVRFVGRQKEFALRTALGAGRASLLRQTLAETLWIAVPGGAAGAILAAWGVAGARAILPADEFVRLEQISMDVRSLAFVLAVSLLSAFAFALAPALTGSRLSIDATLRDWGKTVAGNPRTSRRIGVLIAAEVTLAFLLLFAAGLFINTNAALHQVRLGFDPHSVLTLRIAPGDPGSHSEKSSAFYSEVLDRAGRIAGVERAALASALPLTGTWGVNFLPAGRPRPPPIPPPRHCRCRDQPAPTSGARPCRS